MTGSNANIQDNIRVSGHVSYEQFYHDYLLPNRPAIFTKDLVKSWPAFDLWTSSSSSSSSPQINWTYLVDHYGDHTVSVADCSKRDAFGNLECESDTLRHVVDLWTQGRGEHLYVKDWHLARVVESSKLKSTSPFYTTPSIFSDDWMNAFYTAHTSDDFRFVYLSGSSGAYTPLHRDVYGSYSWSTNIVGRKRWWLFPPEQTPYLFMKNRKRACVQDVRDVDESEFPEFGKARPIVIEQEAGETIFVPSGWYHQVENLTPCISINHNWSNAVNLPTLYTLMCDKVEEVEEALEDVREMLVSSEKSRERDKKGVEVEGGQASWQEEFTKIVQDVVRHDAGWNWLTFWQMVRYALQSLGTSESTADDEKAPCLRYQNTTDSFNSVPNSTSAPFPPAPSQLRPSTSFIHERVHACYCDFIQRKRGECIGEIVDVVRDVSSLLGLAG